MFNIVSVMLSERRVGRFVDKKILRVNFRGGELADDQQEDLFITGAKK